MLRPWCAASAFFAVTLIFGAGMLSSQPFPSKPIRIIVGGAGGGNDFVARLIAQGLGGGTLGQSVIVDNRAGGAAPGEAVAKSPPDGYTLLVSGSSLGVQPLIQTIPYDPVRDFSPITLIATSPNIVLVHPSLPVKSVRDLIALAKARPGELNYASAPTGGLTHLAGELFKSMSGTNIVRVAYKGAGPALNGVVGGEVHLMIGTVTSAVLHVKSGRLRALAVTSLQPTALAPGLPTVAASGVPGYEVVSLDTIYAPAKTPAAIVNRLHEEVVRVITRADVKQKFFDAGMEILAYTPEQSAATIKAEIAQWSKVLKDAGIRAD